MTPRPHPLQRAVRIGSDISFWKQSRAAARGTLLGWHLAQSVRKYLYVCEDVCINGAPSGRKVLGWTVCGMLEAERSWASHSDDRPDILLHPAKALLVIGRWWRRLDIAQSQWMALAPAPWLRGCLGITPLGGILSLVSAAWYS